VESLFHSLKVNIHRKNVLTRAAIRQRVFEYIEVDYNRTRRHSALGYLKPMEY
jgi:transposase InsO family protein